VTTKLILNNKPPTPLRGVSYSREQVLFPSHTIATIFKRMVETSMYDKVQSMLIEILRSIQTVLQKSDDIRTLAYWLSNVDELRCLFSSLDGLLRRDSKGTKSIPGGPKSLSKLRNDIGFLLGELVQHFVKKGKDNLDKMITSAVLEYEGLQGVKKPKGWCPHPFDKSLNFRADFCLYLVTVKPTGAHGPQFTPQIFSIFLGELEQTLKDFFVDEEIAKQSTFFLSFLFLFFLSLGLTDCCLDSFQ